MMLHFQYRPFHWLAILVVVIAGSVPLKAHENTPAIVDITLDGDDVELTLQVNLEALIAGTAAGHESGGEENGANAYLSLRDLSPTALFSAFQPFEPEFRTNLGLTHNGVAVPMALSSHAIPDVGDVELARTSVLTYKFMLKASTGVLKWAYPADYGDSILRVFTPAETDPVFADYIAQGASAQVDLADITPQSMSEVVLDYIVVGFDHIAPKGLDHILFVMGLFLLSAHLRPLLTQVTMFTLAHTITLALGALGIVTVSGAIVEPLIAASIVFVAVENLFTDRLTKWRPFLIFGFGLLHGLGFASVLGEFGLPAEQFIPALIAFNIGVEIGQLAVILACFLAVGLWFRDKVWYHSYIVIPASTAIAVVAGYWFLERIGIIGLIS